MEEKSDSRGRILAVWPGVLGCSSQSESRGTLHGWQLLKDRLTYANVTATLALVVAVGGGIAIAGGGNDDPSDPHPVVARQAGFTLEAGESKKLMKLPKLVTLTAECDGPNDGTIAYESIAKSRLRVAGVAANHSSVDPLSYSFAVQPGETGDFDGPGSPQELPGLHLPQQRQEGHPAGRPDRRHLRLRDPRPGSDRQGLTSRSARRAWGRPARPRPPSRPAGRGRRTSRP